jgi:UDP-N-acetylglucosamine diphosphorylase / glucose-1-phosphate thymidylyltransferase / UDP-N-acetylgalactosamine diphosphorylase / glucosamine-1-phosphate N-acetyltransferase / galactosamine-1-phosphate N-acetyltransferase
MTTPLTTPLVLYDDARARNFEPFALTRPAGELRAGAELTRRRWERAAGSRATGFAGAPHLNAFEEFDAPPSVNGTQEKLAVGTIIANARCAIALDATLGGASLANVWHCDGRVAAVRLTAPLDAARLEDGTFRLDAIANGASVEVRGWWIEEIWDLSARLSNMLVADIAVLAAGADDVPSHVSVLGEHRALAEPGAYFEPYVVIDTTEGPVLVRSGARIAAFTRLVGPCVIGEQVQVGGGKIKNCSIGEHSRVHGELSGTIFIGHANKVHDGFIGDSVLGRWANVGAGSITSNLKNSYGVVSIWTPGGLRKTHLTFLGSYIGDHAKLGIGTRLTTGCVVGAGANVFGSAMPPKFVPPFAWGDAPPFDEFECAKFLDVAAKVMARRDVTLGENGRSALAAAWARRGAFAAAPAK